MSSCYTPRYVYSPAAANVPAFLKKGDSKIAAAFSSNLSGNNAVGSKSHGYDLQAAYAVTNHLALQSDLYDRREKNGGNFNINDSSDIRYHRYLTSFGIGYYKVLDKNIRAVFEVFAGAGSGKFRFTDNGKKASNIYYSNFYEAGATRFYIQPAFILHSRGSFIASLATRLSVVKFNRVKTDYSATDLDNYKLDGVDEKPFVFWEPTTLFSFGNRHVPGVQLEFQTGLSILQSEKFVDYRSFNFSAAIVLDLPKIIDRKRNPAASKKQ